LIFIVKALYDRDIVRFQDEKGGFKFEIRYQFWLHNLLQLKLESACFIVFTCRHREHGCTPPRLAGGWQPCRVLAYLFIFSGAVELVLV